MSQHDIIEAEFTLCFVKNDAAQTYPLKTVIL